MVLTNGTDHTDLFNHNINVNVNLNFWGTRRSTTILLEDVVTLPTNEEDNLSQRFITTKQEFHYD